MDRTRDFSRVASVLNGATEIASTALLPARPRRNGLPSSRLVEDLHEEVVGIAQNHDVSGSNTDRLASRGYDRESGRFQSLQQRIDITHDQPKHARAGIVNRGSDHLPVAAPVFDKLHFKIRARDFTNTP